MSVTNLLWTKYYQPIKVQRRY